MKLSFLIFMIIFSNTTWCGIESVKDHGCAWTNKGYLECDIKSSLKGKKHITFKPSFNCNKAKTVIEKLVCKSTLLSLTDSLMSDLYGKLVKKGKFLKELKATQRKWASNRERFSIKKSRAGYIVDNKIVYSEENLYYTYRERLEALFHFNYLVDNYSGDHLIYPLFSYYNFKNKGLSYLKPKLKKIMVTLFPVLLKKMEIGASFSGAPLINGRYLVINIFSPPGTTRWPANEKTYEFYLVLDLKTEKIGSSRFIVGSPESRLV